MLTIVSEVTPGLASPYGENHAIVPLPPRMRFLHPDAVTALSSIWQSLVFTDMFRSMEASAEAYESGKRGVQPPGYSAHNYAIAFDLDVSRTLKRLGLTVDRAGKVKLDSLLEGLHFICYRDDHEVDEIEAWHYTWGAKGHGSKEIEATIQRMYGDSLKLNEIEVQTALKKLRLYSGDLDGKLGPISRQAITLFQRQWRLEQTGSADVRTQRLLAVAAHEKKIIPSRFVA